MAERTGELTFKGEPLTLMGPKLKPGDPAPDATLIANDLSEVKLSDSQGKVRILSVVPSLDTSVCSTQTRTFNEKVAALGDNVVCYTVSADLPFAQKRWCGAEGIENVVTLSDHRDMAFADAYGTHIKELRLDSRAVFVVDGGGTIRYVEYVPEMTNEPDYSAPLEVARELA